MNEVFETKDFYLACFLKARGIKLINASVAPNKISEVVFTFEKLRNLEEVINNFYNENELIPAIRFVNAIRDLKALSHSVIKIRGERWQDRI